MKKIYISTRYIYNEEGDLIHEQGDVLDRDYGDNLCDEVSISDLSQLYVLVGDMLENFVYCPDETGAIEDTLEDVTKLMYAISQGRR